MLTKCTEKHIQLLMYEISHIGHILVSIVLTYE